MFDNAARLLQERTGAGLAEWNQRTRDSGATDEEALRTWLTEQGVTGYPQMMLVMERFGYPDFLLATADTLIDGQYADRPALRPILDAVLAASAGVGEVTVQARKTYVALVSPRRTFAMVQATTRSRVDLALKLPDDQPGGRLLPAKSMAHGNLRVALTDASQVDDEVVDLLARSYRANV
jgi:hypothetical protein